MFGSNLFKDLVPSTVEIDVQQPSIQGLASKEIDRWLEGTEVIDLGSPKRDEAIMPTTWHGG